MEMRAAELPGQRELLDWFFAQALEASAGAELTSKDFFNAFQTWCRARKVRPCTQAFFHRRATIKFGRASHCFGPKGTQRGRSGWRLKPEFIYNTDMGSNQPGTSPQS
jgi:hypothetical protein